MKMISLKESLIEFMKPYLPPTFDIGLLGAWVDSRIMELEQHMRDFGELKFEDPNAAIGFGICFNETFRFLRGET